MPTYYQLCVAMGNAGPYMTDVIGKCLRETKAFSGTGPSRADKYLAESATFKAAMAGRSLKSEFRSGRSEKGYLVWRESRKYSTVARYPVEVDETAGVVRQINQEVYGLLVDVVECLHRKTSDGRFVRWDLKLADGAETWAGPTQEEVKAHDANQSKFGTDGRRGRVQHAEWAERVAKLWDYSCAITGCRIRSLLDGAHVLPHKEGTTAQRLDEQNGIYMVTQLHRAFDRGLISFSDDGVLLIAPQLDDADRQASGIPPEAKLKFIPERLPAYLAHHRKRFGFR